MKAAYRKGLRAIACALIALALTVSAGAWAKGETEPIVLRINREPAITEEENRFMAENPGIRLEFVETPRRYEEVWEHLQACKKYGLEDIDIFYVWSESGISPELLAATGMAAPIQDPFLKAEVEAMFPVVGEYLTVNGVLMGYPDMLYSSWTEVNREALTQMGFEKPAADFSTFLSQMGEWWQGEHRYTDDGTLIVDAFDGYTSLRWAQEEAIRLLVRLQLEEARQWKVPALDTAKNRELVERVCALTEGMKVEEKENNISWLYSINSFGPLVGAYSSNYDDSAYLEPICLDPTGWQHYHCDMFYYIINPNSPRREAAERYLAFLAKQKKPIVYLYSLYPQTEPAMEYGSVVIPQEAIDRYAREQFFFDIPQCQALIYRHRWDSVCTLLMEQLLDGEITASQYLKRLEARLSEIAAYCRGLMTGEPFLR